MCCQLNMPATKQTPEINFDAQHFMLSIRGESYPENILELSTPLFRWLDECLHTLPAEQMLQIDIELIYFNSSSSKLLLDFFDRLSVGITEQHKKIQVNWYYDVENDSALESGEEFKEDLDDLPFYIIEKNY